MDKDTLKDYLLDILTVLDEPTEKENCDSCTENANRLIITSIKNIIVLEMWKCKFLSIVKKFKYTFKIYLSKSKDELLKHLDNLIGE